MTKKDASLREIVDGKAAMARTRRLDISFNELKDMYESEARELEITPAFQRVFVWNEIQQSQFIESLLLELPIPPLYVIESAEGHYTLIDGLQRLSSYFHFRGVLDNQHQDIVRGKYLTLEGCDIAPALNGCTWNTIDTALQVRLKRAFVSLQVIRKDSDADLKYHMFKRLNSGGTQISPQQVRNAYVRMLEDGDRIMDFVEELSKIPSFNLTCYEVLTDAKKNSQLGQEYVLRFLAFKNNRASYVKDVATFVDGYTESVARRKPLSNGAMFDYEGERENFKKTFDVLAASTAERSFTFPNKTLKELTTGFSAYHFEGVSLAIQSILDKLNPDNSAQMELLKNALTAVRLSPEFFDVSSGGGKNTRNKLDERVRLVTSAIAGCVA